MPVMDGLAATAAIRKAERAQTPDALPVRIVGLTAHAALEDEARRRSAGMDDVLVKPIRRDSLLDALGATTPQADPLLRRTTQRKDLSFAV